MPLAFPPQYRHDDLSYYSIGAVDTARLNNNLWTTHTRKSYRFVYLWFCSFLLNNQRLAIFVCYLSQELPPSKFLPSSYTTLWTWLYDSQLPCFSFVRSRAPFLTWRPTSFIEVFEILLRHTTRITGRFLRRDLCHRFLDVWVYLFALHIQLYILFGNARPVVETINKNHPSVLD
jgi:hypothetical protein